MMRVLVLFSVFAMVVSWTPHDGITDPFDCSSTGKCEPGMYCDKGTCYARTDCPQLAQPQLSPGCRLVAQTDERNCPTLQVVCRRLRATRNNNKNKKPSCPKNAEWKECSDICPAKSCDNIMGVSSCFSLRCGSPACVCKAGHVFLSQKDKTQGCVRRETCNTLNKLRTAQANMKNRGGK